MPKYLEDLPTTARIMPCWFDEYADEARKGKGLWSETRTFDNARQAGSAASSMNRSKRYGNGGGKPEDAEFVFASRNHVVYAALNI